MKKLLIAFILVFIGINSLYADRATAAAKAIIAAANLESNGYYIRNIPGRYLRQGHYRTYNRYLYRGSCYAIVGVGDNSVRDLDVYVWDNYWNLVAEDSDSSSVSVASFCPRHSGTYHIRTKMYSGHGFFYQVIAYK